MWYMFVSFDLWKSNYVCLAWPMHPYCMQLRNTICDSCESFAVSGSGWQQGSRTRNNFPAMLNLLSNWIHLWSEIYLLDIFLEYYYYSVETLYAVTRKPLSRRPNVRLPLDAPVSSWGGFPIPWYNTTKCALPPVPLYHMIWTPPPLTLFYYGICHTVKLAQNACANSIRWMHKHFWPI